jgi:hypothetical protein
MFMLKLCRETNADLDSRVTAYIAWTNIHQVTCGVQGLFASRCRIQQGDERIDKGKFNIVEELLLAITG